MSIGKWKILFRGELQSGFVRGDVEQSFARIFRLSEARVAQIFSHPEVVLRRHLAHDQAQHYQRLLTRIGMATHLEEESGKGVTATMESPAPGVPTMAPETGGTEPRQLPFHFSGQGGEYFQIWIVNILLSIVTLGIYSAWAKVRNKRYFYGNTQLDGASFDYLANPITILKGRLIAVGLFALLSAINAVAPYLSPIASLLFMLVFPWLVCRSLSFNGRNSAYRNVTFGFGGRYGGAFVAFILWPFAGLLTLGLLLPLAFQRQQQFIIGNSRFGGTRFEFEGSVGDFYRVFGLGLLLFIAAIAVIMLISQLLPFFGVTIFFAYLLVVVYFNVTLTNLKFNNSLLQQHGFIADYELRSYGLLFLINSLLVVVTLGLYIPWAKVSFARYKSEHIAFVAIGSLDDFVGVEEGRVSAIGQEVADIFDFDIGI